MRDWGGWCRRCGDRILDIGSDDDRHSGRLPNPERCVIGHPFNPPYLLPLVEIVGGKKTDPEAVAWAGAFYEIAGKAPLMMKKEIPGFVATRLQEALWREALHMVANGEATPTILTSR